MSEGQFNLSKVHKLDSEGRLLDLKPAILLGEVAQLARGIKCVDFGSGTGTFTIPMAEIIGESGIVYAVDNSKVMMNHLRDRVPPKNLKFINRSANDTKLPDASADFCLLAFILHEVKQPIQLLVEANRILKLKGKIMAVEWKADREGFGPPKRIRISEDTLKNLITTIGSFSYHYFNWSEHHYVLLADKH